MKKLRITFQALFISFDRSDLKWAATYICGGGEALYNALDSDWKESAKELSDAEIMS